ncbi:MAG: bifunctional glutamate N-acetyltransferase/amino-acid acetyltransferase ArgJ [Planctomycetia bacterium]|nr:bifunctional glutamate N-acetyltransferase/amino-acid acetyltransferase ArgJ [Planctomycetia bacterium]
MSHFIPHGFRFASVCSGIKHEAGRADLALIVSDVPATAAGVYTKNLVCAAPVTFDRERTPGRGFRAVVVNSGNANACTGKRGMEDAVAMARFAACAIGAADDAALVMSTGVIGHFLPMDKIEAGIYAAAQILASDEEALTNAAKGIMTTDTRHKLFSKSVTLDDGREVRIVGMAKGAGMIAPNMATFLGVVATDAVLEPEEAQSLLRTIADKTFNCITVEGHTSTNDTLILLANGAAGGASAASNPDFCAALESVCEDLARSIPEDGEGASHLVTIRVLGLKEESHARTIAKLIAESPLVKCAFAGNDPNWGRIVSAAGYSGVEFDVSKVSLRVNQFLLFQNGAPVDFDPETVAKSMRENKEIDVELRFGEGTASARFWTCDLTKEYVSINADYHT